MIAEDLLERGLADAAREYDVPADAVDRLREHIAPAIDDTDGMAPPRSWMSWRPGPRGWLALAAAAIVLLIAVPIAVGGGTSRSHVTPAAIRSDSAGVNASGGESAAASSGGSAGAGAVKGVVPAQAPAVAAPAPAPLRLQHGVAAPRAGAGTFSGSTTAGSGSTAGAGPAGPLPPIPAVPDRVVKTGELDLQVVKGQVSSTINRLTALATLERGYVADSRTSEGGIAPSGEVTLRVPVNAFEQTVSRARQITGVKVLALETSGQDVTSKYVDVQARIKALKATRNTFLTLLSKASTIGETLAVQQHVTDVQTQIDQLKGQLNVLRNRSSLSTLTVTVDQKLVTPVATKHHSESGLLKAVHRSVSRFVHGIEAIIGVIGPLLLAVLLIAFAWLAVRFGYRMLRRRMV